MTRGTIVLGLILLAGSVGASIGVAIFALPIRSGFDVAVGFGGFAGATLVLAGAFAKAIAAAMREK